MSIDLTFFSVFLVTVIAYIALFLYILRLDEPFGAERWMAVYCLWSVVMAGVLALSDTQTGFLGRAPGLWLALASAVGIGLLGAITFGNLELPNLRVWIIALPIVVTLIWVGDMLDPTPGLRELTWRGALSGPDGWLPALAAGAWGISAAGLIGLSYYFVTQATLPLLANRRFWWVIALVVILAGEAMSMWGVGVVAMLAQAMRLVGVTIAVYATTHLELIDVRGIVRAIIGNALFVGVMAAFIIIGIYISTYLLANLPGLEAQVGTIAVAIILAIIYQRLRPALYSVVSRAVLATGYDTAQVVKGYSQRIANIIDTGELAIAVGITMAQAVQATKFGLLLLTPEKIKTKADVLIGGGKLPTQPHTFENTSLFLQTLLTTHRPLSQYAIDYDPKYKSISADDRTWLRGLGADMYVPIFDNDALNAIMAVGARASGDPYRQAELDLMLSLAEQTSVALKNARLVTNLRILNDEMRTVNEGMRMLNKELADNNERLRQMDKVKTDFINIASHELRTPLTKVKGFSDIMNEMAVDGDLDDAMLKMATDQISRASARLEEIISQMLDISQLDVEALTLAYTGTSVERVLQIAGDSLKYAMVERNLSFTVHDAPNMPSIEADFQRLVQTFRQLIGNAIKFTPDGGRIDVYCNYVPPNEERDRPEAVEIVVADTGVGIEPEHCELIFEKFYRVGDVDLHSTGDTKFMGAGPGLGLTVARGVIKAHNGQIWAESPGFNPETFPGSQFHILLPVRRLNAAEVSGPA
jgi:signal transduction histidine kinase